MRRARQPPVSRVRQAIRQVVHENPGIHFRGLARCAGVTSAGQLRHHLDRLQQRGVLVELSDGRYKRFFIAADHDARMRPEMARLSRVVPRRIARLLLARPMNRSQLRRHLGCADSTLGYHLSRMLQSGDLVRDRGPTMCMYSLTHSDTVRNVLAQDDPGLADEPLAGDEEGLALRPATPGPPGGRHSSPPGPPPPLPPPPPSPPVPQPRLPEPLPDLPDPIFEPDPADPADPFDPIDRDEPDDAAGAFGGPLR